MTTKLGKLERVEIREIWSHEAQMLTPWLARHLGELGEEILIDFDEDATSTEVPVGGFSIDILGKDSDGRTVIIENQLERTDHDHLGKCITYAAGKGASTIIWVTKEAREEHRKAVEWLNSISLDEVRFFLVQIEVWRIGDSAPAPKFNVVESPNEWAKAMSRPVTKSTPLKLAQREFWVDFVDYARQHTRRIRSWHTPHPQHWHDISFGLKGAHLSLTANSKEKTVSVQLYIDSGSQEDNKAFFDRLHRDRATLEQQLGKLHWLRNDAKQASIVYLNTKLDFQSPTDRQQAIEWLVEHADQFIDVFGQYREG
ncbi:MAG: DUF4268 domain-containing protein [Micrococcales bacterium]|nr:DUF4268 domain-containing protein [Micrococcales bacterium]